MGIGHSLGMFLQYLPGCHLYAWHAQGAEFKIHRIHGAVTNWGQEGVHIINTDGGEFTVASNTPMQVFLQTHHLTQTVLIQWRHDHHGADNIRSEGILCHHSWINIHGNVTIKNIKLG